MKCFDRGMFSGVTCFLHDWRSSNSSCSETSPESDHCVFSPYWQRQGWTRSQFGIREPKQTGCIWMPMGPPPHVLSATSQIPAVVLVASSVTASTHFSLTASCPVCILCSLLSALQLLQKEGRVYLAYTSRNLLSLYTIHSSLLHNQMAHLGSSPTVLSRQQSREQR